MSLSQEQKEEEKKVAATQQNSKATMNWVNSGLFIGEVSLKQVVSSPVPPLQPGAAQLRCYL